jgi:hypothetical protein
VIGVSGGLDSAQALIVTVRAMDRLGLPRTNVLAFSMPGFATRNRTRTNALALMRALGVTAGEIDIRPSCLQMLKDIDHPFASGKMIYDVTFENVQAGDRTSHLFRLANQHRGLVVGTSDLSQLAQPLRLSSQPCGLSCRPADTLEPVKSELAEELFRRVPAGVGRRGRLHLNDDQLDEMLTGGARWAVEQGYGRPGDLDRIEDDGRAADALPARVSQHARDRQRDEMGTLGSGNHYLEVQRVADILAPDVSHVQGR